MQPPLSKERILKAACRIFANCGYEGASIQDIVKAARVTKPTLYYYFKSKEGLYRALVEHAQEERFQLIEKAAAQHATLSDQLIAVVNALYGYARDNRDLTRICFASFFASPGEIPCHAKMIEKGKRNFELVQGLIEKARRQGALKTRFSTIELTSAFFAQILFYAVSQAVRNEQAVQHANAKKAVHLFLEGAIVRKSAARKAS